MAGSLIAVGLSLGATMAIAAPADAHTDQLYAQGGGGHAVVSQDHHHISVCDTRGDGTPVRGEYWSWSLYFATGSGYGFNSDTHGRRGCTTRAPGYIAWYRVCKGPFCTGWRQP